MTRTAMWILAALALSAPLARAEKIAGQPMAPVLSNTDRCRPAQLRVQHIALRLPGCCTEASGCARALATTRLGHPGRAHHA